MANKSDIQKGISLTYKTPVNDSLPLGSSPETAEGPSLGGIKPMMEQTSRYIIYPENALGLFGLESIVSKLSFLEDAFEHAHRKTRNEIFHRALGDAYKTISYLKDSIIEEYMGYSGETYENYVTVPINGFDMFFLRNVLDDLQTFSDELCFIAKIRKFLSIENLSQELSKVGARLSYKLSLNDTI